MADSSFALDKLPFDCLYCICEYLSVEDLSRFSRVCTIFNSVASSESLWRLQCLSRWPFCDVREISSGDGRWCRYFQARRKLEAGMEQGRPGRDYRVKSLRAHEQDVVDIVAVEGSTIDWEHPTLPAIVSLSRDGVVHAWDVMEGKPVFSLEQRNITCLAGNEHEIAVGGSNSHVTIYGTVDWSMKCNLTVPLEERMKILSLQYGKINRRRGQPLSVLMVDALGVDSGDNFIVVWDSSHPANPLSLLSVNIDSTDETALALDLSPSGWLAASKAVSAPLVYVWQLSSIVSSSPAPPAEAKSSPPRLSPLPPLVTLYVQCVSSPPFVWLSPGVLVTCDQVQPPIVQHPVARRLPGHVWAPSHSSATLSVWDVAKFVEEQKNVQPLGEYHLYNSKSAISLTPAPTAIAYRHGVLLAGDSEGSVRIIDPSSGKVISHFKDHLGAVTDLYADRFRVLSCSKDYSIRVYCWKWAGKGNMSRPQLESRYQLLGGSVAHKTHAGFHRVTCTSTSCVGAAGNVIKLYNFVHHLASSGQK